MTKFCFVFVNQLPDVCSFQYINYTINIEETSVGTVSLLGPFTHQGSERVSHNINSGLRRETEYLVWVHVDSAVGSSVSDKHYFSVSKQILKQLVLSCGHPTY